MVRELKKTEKFLGFDRPSDIFDSMEDMVRIIDSDGRVLFKNRAMLKFEKDLDIKSLEIFPKDQARDSFRVGKSSETEFCIANMVFSVISSPIKYHESKKALIQVFRDISLKSRFTHEIYGDNKKMVEDMEFAQSIQKGMLPMLKEYGKLGFEYRYMPSERLSGDFFDLVPLGGGKLALYISDVVGHGISASILTMFVRQTMRSILNDEKICQPAKVLQSLKGKFNEISTGDRQYFTIFYALFDSDASLMTYANAGHNSLPIVSGENGVFELEARGKVISPIFKDYKYIEHKFEYSKGDKILFYTDGAVEARNEAGKSFGKDAIIRRMKENSKGLLDLMAKDMEEFRYGPQQDDIALLMVDCK